MPSTFTPTGLWLAPKAVLHQYHGEVLRSADSLAFEAAYAGYEYNRQHLQELPGLLEYLWHNRAALPSFYLRNLGAELRQALTSLSFTLGLWLPFATWGAIKLWRSAHGPFKVLFLALTALPALIYPLSVVDPRYLLPILPAAMLLAAVGMSTLIAGGQRSTVDANRPSPVLTASPWDGGRRMANHPWAMTIIPVAILLLCLVADLAGPFLIPRPIEYKALGNWLAANGIGQGDTALARKRQVPFYAGARWAWLPLTDTVGLLTHAAERGARYVVVDERTFPALRPGLAYLLDPSQAPDSLALVDEVEVGGNRVLLYRIR